MKSDLITSLLCGIMCNFSIAQSDAPKEDDFYPITRLAIPEGIVLEVGAIEPLPTGTLSVATRRGDIYRVANAWNDDSTAATFELYAQGLHEILGLSYKDGWLYATQRGEVTRLRDTDNDGRADDFETFNDSWSIAGDYHEYAFGSPFDKDGNMWVTLSLTGSFNSDCPWRGWALRIDETGKMIPTCSGIRSPGGIAFNAEGDVFYTDNQGSDRAQETLPIVRKQQPPPGHKTRPLPFITRRVMATISTKRMPLGSRFAPHLRNAKTKWVYSPEQNLIVHRIVIGAKSRNPNARARHWTQCELRRENRQRESQLKDVNTVA